MDMSLASHLSNQCLILDFVHRKTSSELLEERRKLSWLSASGTKKLQGATLNTHYESSFVGSSLSDYFVSG